MAPGQTDAGGVVVSPEIQKSRLDKRQYRALTLPNTLRVVLVTDMSSEKAAASMDVAVGNFSDPRDLPGLAHFLEHMLFLGTEKFPDEASFSDFLGENSGYTNAYTSGENTNFHFELTVTDRDPHQPSPRFRDALDRFAQFFTAPLFTESATDRELNAVDSEHQKNLQNDHRRIFQLKQALSNPNHPSCGFGTGSRETLYDIPRQQGIDTRQKLLDFYATYYSANLMSLCIVAPYPLDVLQAWVSQLFSDIANNQVRDPSLAYAHIPALLDDQCGRMIYVEPVCNIRTLELSWIIPSWLSHFRIKPARFLSSLLGDEGPGSILSLLKSYGWCDKLSAGNQTGQTYDTMLVLVTLTTEGVDHVDEIVSIIYQYTRVIKQSGISRWLYDEEACLSELVYRFRDPDGAIDCARNMASCARLFPLPELLTAQYLYSEFDAKVIAEYLELLTPERGTVVIVGQFVADKVDKKERWYGTSYRLEPISMEKLESWRTSKAKEGLFVPPPNPFIPTEFDILGKQLEDGEDDVEGPSLIFSDEYLDLYHKLDCTFRRPKAKLILELRTPLAYNSPTNVIMGSLFTSLVQDMLTEIVYPAERARFSYHLYMMPTGLQIVLSGYSHRFDVVLDAIVGKMISFEADEVRFEVQRERLKRRYENISRKEPYKLVLYRMNDTLERPHYHVDEYLRVMNTGDITLEAFKEYQSQLLTKMKARALLIGNISETDSRDMVRGVVEALGFKPLSPYEDHTKRVVQVPVGRDVFVRTAHLNPDDNNSAINVFFQIGAYSNEDSRANLTTELLSDILQKPTFNELRTKQQLGYIVMEVMMPIEGVRGICILVQSTIADPDELLDRIDEFLVQVRADVLGDMTDEKFADYRNSLAKSKSEPDRTIDRRARRFWDEISMGWNKFNRPQVEVEALPHVSRQDVLKQFDDCVASGGCRRKRVIVQYFGSQHPFENRRPLSEGAIDVKNTVAFQNECSLYAVVGRFGGGVLP